jgi:hypothetical protein
MFICTICRFDTAYDDLAIPAGVGRGICLRCFGRETNTTRPMPKALRRAVRAPLDAVELAS